MRSYIQHLGNPSMVLVGPSRWSQVKAIVNRLRRQARFMLCTVVNGGHELYRARTDTKLFQQCLLCGYETEGWTIDRRDRRLHLVTGEQRHDRTHRV